MLGLMDSGRVLATDTLAGLVEARGLTTFEDAFIAYLEEASKAVTGVTSRHRIGAAAEIWC
jgi:ribosome-dependent ATPase